jgi:transcriptional regulator with XRE-family HTH domain
MDGQALVELALKELGCSQKELALKLGVSSTQVSKWKTDSKEHMSTEMERKLSEIARIGERYPRFVALAGSLKDAIKWEKLVKYQADLADFAAEIPYDTYLLDTDEDDGNVLRALCWHTFDALQQMGVVLPATFPKELDPKDTLNDTFDTEKHFDARLTKALERNPYATLIYAIFKSLTSVSGFNSAYIQELMDDDDLGLDGEDFYGSEFEYCLVYLAAAKTEVDEKFAPNFRQFRHQWLKRYEKWVTTIKDRAFRAGVPLRVELLNLVYDDNEDLDQACERESWGFNATRLHPDIYINELLVGMRIIHQVLPAILEKLGIDKTFKLDETALRLDRPTTIQWGSDTEAHQKAD